MKKKFEISFGGDCALSIFTPVLPVVHIHNAILLPQNARYKLILAAFDDVKPTQKSLKALCCKGYRFNST
jgi:hypothetical protein